MKVNNTYDLLLKKLKRVESIMEMLECCYIGRDYTSMSNIDKERMDSSFYLLHDEIKDIIEILN